MMGQPFQRVLQCRQITQRARATEQRIAEHDELVDVQRGRQLVPDRDRRDDGQPGNCSSSQRDCRVVPNDACTITPGGCLHCDHVERGPWCLQPQRDGEPQDGGGRLVAEQLCPVHEGEIGVGAHNDALADCLWVGLGAPGRHRLVGRRTDPVKRRIQGAAPQCAPRDTGTRGIRHTEGAPCERGRQPHAAGTTVHSGLVASRDLVVHAQMIAQSPPGASKLSTVRTCSEAQVH